MEWRSDGNEKFIFDNDSVCIIYYNGELTIIMYGKNAVRNQPPLGLHWCLIKPMGTILQEGSRGLRAP